MRVRPLLGEKVWFRPRGRWMFGWGWEPASWEGWGVTAAFVAASALGVPRLKGAALFVGVGVLVALFSAVVVVKGTSPGGAKKLAAYQRSTLSHSAFDDPASEDPHLDEVAARFRQRRAEREPQ